MKYIKNKYNKKEITRIFIIELIYKKKKINI